jgi:hypothetical protein
VVFGADLPLDQRVYSLPDDAVRQLPHDSIAREMRTRGGAVSGVVLLADPNGMLKDECLWLLAANPDPSRPFPSSVDHLRTVMRGWRSQAQLGHLVERVAAAVAGAAWKLPLSSPDNVGLPVGPHDARWDRLQAQQGFATTNATAVPWRHGCSIWRRPRPAPSSRCPQPLEARPPVASSPRRHLAATRASR